MPDDDLHPETIPVIAGRPAREPGAPLKEPLTPASTFHHGGELGYGRDGNPGWEGVGRALGALEHGHCVIFASGLAAVSAVLDELPAGTRVIGQRAPYYGVAQVLRERASRGLLTSEPHDTLTIDGLGSTIDYLGLLWIESPSNPMLDVVDLP